MDKKEMYTQLCTGCGLCKSIKNTQFYKDEQGFSYPKLSDSIIEFCDGVCPASGSGLNSLSTSKIWGCNEEIDIGWSLDSTIRSKASSGGILTSLCIYLLENKMVGGIIQTKGDDKRPWQTETRISYTKKDVLECMGSRYAISQPLGNIKQIVKENEIYAFVGKPCDVTSLKMYLKEDAKLEKQIAYCFSFFCAGEPSENANINLIKELGCEKVEDCISLQYRGNGWPGFATIKDKYDNTYSMTYDESWGKILGREIRKSCRFCIDGIGEMADISCGDMWYLTEDNTPDFSENQGRNIVFARSNSGKNLLKEAAKNKKIYIEKQENIDSLKYIQKYQFERKATMADMIRALKIFHKIFPAYNMRKLKHYAKNISLRFRLKRFLGTCKRCINNKI